MKKLLVLATVAVAAAAAHAANITWGARNICIPVAADVTVSQTGISASSGSRFAADALTVALYWVNSSGGHELINSFATTGDGLIATQTLGSGTTSEIYQAMVADQGTTWKPEYYFTATYTTADGTYEYTGSAFATVAVGDVASKAVSVLANFGSAGTWNYTAAPEPTSGLLLLLGVAGLALKRKRA